MRHARNAMRGLDRDIRAAQVATLFRKGVSTKEVQQMFRMSESALRQLAFDYDFPWPELRSANWPKAGDRGERGKVVTAYENWARAVAGARRTIRGQAGQTSGSW